MHPHRGRLNASPSDRPRAQERGQLLPLAVIALSALLLAVGLALDGGYAWTRRRVAQNAADFAALAGARLVVRNLASLGAPDSSSMKYVTDDGDIRAAIDRALGDNGALPADYGAASGGPRYVDANGAPLPGDAGYVGNGILPAAARGIQVTARLEWRPFLVGLAGIESWTATAEATASGDYFPPQIGGAVVPVTVLWPTALPTQAPIPGIDHGAQPGWEACTASMNAACPRSRVRLGLSGAYGGQFGWLGWRGNTGARALCDLLRPPSSAPSYTVAYRSSVTIPGNPGKKNPPCIREAVEAWASMKRVVWVPVASPGPGTCPAYCYPGTTSPYPATFYGSGGKARVHMIGFAGFQLVGCGQPCIDDIRAIYRGPFFLGPTGTDTLTANESWEVRLIR